MGNTRITFADLNNNNVVDVPGDILQENHYYPFGMNMNYSWMNNAGLQDTRYQYNGKELNDDYGLNLSDYGARWYDAGLVRWWSVDPMADQSAHTSTFMFSDNSPIIIIDPNGMFSQDFLNAQAEGQERYEKSRFIRNMQNSSAATVHIIRLEGVNKSVIDGAKDFLDDAAKAANLNVNFQIEKNTKFDIRVVVT